MLIGKSCSSLINDDAKFYDDFMFYANEQLATSFQYLFMSAQFGSYEKDRPGFEKVFHGLSDKAWNNGVDMIKEMSKRGAKFNFEKITKPIKSMVPSNEITAMEAAASIEKDFLKSAISVHRVHSHAYKDSNEPKLHEKYDSGISHYMDEKIIEDQTETVRTLTGYVNDLMKFVKDTPSYSIALYMFDEYLKN